MRKFLIEMNNLRFLEDIDEEYRKLCYYIFWKNALE